MIKSFIFVTTLLLSITHLSADNDKPNIIFIFADDMAYETIGAFGELDIETPNIDRLVKQGTTFSHAYNMGSYKAAVCIASRTMLMTGRSVWSAQNANIEEMIEKKESWPLQMKQAGYNTYLTGKWHVQTDSNKHFDQTKNIRAGMPITDNSVYNRPLSTEHYENGWKPWDETLKGFWEGGKHWSEVTAEDTIFFIEEASKKDKPFFIYSAFNAPHDPRQAPKEYIDKYPLDRIEIPKSFQPEHPHAKELCGKKLRDERLMPYPRTKYSVKVNRQEYFAIISHMDTQIGRILDAVEASGKADNTYIIFTADHGLAVGHHGLSGKQNLYEHSTRVPFILTGPNIAKEKTINTPIYLQDISTTTIELTGEKAPESYFYKSLLPLLEDSNIPHYNTIFGTYLNHQRSITKDHWKLISITKAKAYELYDLKADPQEINNLANDPLHSAKKQELLTLLAEEEKSLRSRAKK